MTSAYASKTPEASAGVVEPADGEGDRAATLAHRGSQDSLDPRGRRRPTLASRTADQDQLARPELARAGQSFERRADVRHAQEHDPFGGRRSLGPGVADLDADTLPAPLELGERRLPRAAAAIEELERIAGPEASNLDQVVGLFGVEAQRQTRAQSGAVRGREGPNAHGSPAFDMSSAVHPPSSSWASSESSPA